MQSNATTGHSNRIHSSSERLDSSTAIILQKHRAREEPSKLRAAEYVERNDHAKRDGEVPVAAFNASRSMKVMGVNLHREQHEHEVLLCIHSGEGVASVQAGRIRPRDSSTCRAIDL